MTSTSRSILSNNRAIPDDIPYPTDCHPKKKKKKKKKKNNKKKKKKAKGQPVNPQPYHLTVAQSSSEKEEEKGMEGENTHFDLVVSANFLWSAKMVDLYTGSFFIAMNCSTSRNWIWTMQS